MLREPLHMHRRRQPILIADRMFEHPAQLSSTVLKIANVHARILMKQDVDDTDREISNDESEDPGWSALSFYMEEDDLDIWPEVLHLDQVQRDKIIRTKRVPLPKTQSQVYTVIAHTPLPNL